MELTGDEEKVLGGGSGPARELAMRILVNLGELEGADSLIPIVSAHISGVSYKTGGEGLIKMLERFHDDGGKVSVPSSLNPAGMDLDRWEGMGIDPAFAEKQGRIIELYSSLGVQTTCTCIPYEIFSRVHPVGFGDHIAWGESNAVIYANSMLGARTNREGAISCLASAIVGRTPNYGMHLDERRLPTIEVTIEGELTPLHHDLLGAYIGVNFNSEIPLIRGMGSPERPELKHMGAAMAAKGGLALYHVEGVTPESKRCDPSSFENNIKERVEISTEELSAVKEELYPTIDGEIDTFVIGCPQLGEFEFRRLNRALEGKALLPGKRILAFTSRDLLSSLDVELVRGVERAGVEIYRDTCMVVSPLDMMGVSRAGTDSGKAAHYLPRMSRISTELMPIEMIIEKATGPR
ncbi:MAG: aconitase X catalytic domain-containing protein [Thermoplasmata archaeon]|nr:aconitase X catalytic domain-containing protein [Thermoplasmata archaeon]